MAKSKFDDFCREAFDFLDRSGVRYLVIGGLAVVAVGEPRTTADVDVVGYLSYEDAESLIPMAIRAGFRAQRSTELKRLNATGTLRFRRGRFQLDIILASLPFEETAFRRSMKKRLFGRKVHLPTPEDLILFKVLAGREKDILDAVGIVRRHGKKLDVRYLEKTLHPICDLAEDLDPMRKLRDVIQRGSIGT